MTELPSFPDEEAIVAGLGERGLSEWGARVVAPQIAALRSPLREAFLSWWQTGKMPDVSVQGKSAQSLVDAGAQPLAALLSLDALERNPALVKSRLRRGRERFTPVRFGGLPLPSSGENA